MEQVRLSIMKIAVCGTQSVGKTTLINELLASSSDSFYHIREVARQVIARGLPLGKAGTVESYNLFSVLQMDYEAAFQTSNFRHLISDRCLVDLLAHGKVNEEIGVTEWPKYYLELLERLTLNSCRQYDILVYVPIMFEQENDGIRDEDENYRVLVSQKIEQVINSVGIEIHKIQSQSLEERLVELKDLLVDHAKA